MILQAGQQVNPHIKVLSVENNNIKRRVKEAIVDHCYQTKKPFLNSMNRDEGLDLLASYNHLSGIRRLSKKSFVGYHMARYVTTFVLRNLTLHKADKLRAIRTKNCFCFSSQILLWVLEFFCTKWPFWVTIFKSLCRLHSVNVKLKF